MAINPQDGITMIDRIGDTTARLETVSDTPVSLPNGEPT
jgi:hypothetical protein